MCIMCICVCCSSAGGCLNEAFKAETLLLSVQILYLHIVLITCVCKLQHTGRKEESSHVDFLTSDY